jgi:hypothetical protein
MSTDGMILRGENEALREINKPCVIFSGTIPVLNALGSHSSVCGEKPVLHVISWDSSFKIPTKTGWKHGQLWLFRAFISLL